MIPIVQLPLLSAISRTAFLVTVLLLPSILHAQTEANPVIFTENCGQLVSGTLYTAATPRLRAHFQRGSIVLELPAKDAAPVVGLRWQPIGADSACLPRADEPLAGRVNVYRGGSAFEGIPTYASITYESLYPGIGLVYSGQGSTMKSEWIVSPGADPSLIRWRYEGADGVAIREDGQLEIITPTGRLTEAAPVSYQSTLEGRHSIESRFEIFPGGEVGLWIAEYDPSLELRIDPDLEWSTFLGGSDQDEIYGIDVDAAGNVYLGGITRSTDFPVTPGAFDETSVPGTWDGFVTKLDASGALVWATYLAGSSDDYLRKIAVDSAGSVAFGMVTESVDFPVTPGAFDTHLDGVEDMVIGKLDPAGGTLGFATFLGGSTYAVPSGENPYGLAVDAAGHVYVAGWTWSPDYPVTPGAYDTVFTGPSSDCVVTKIDASGSFLQYSTFLGGTGYSEYADDLAVDAAGRATVVGFTEPDFPTTPGAFDRTSGGIFVAQLDPTGSALVYSTFLSAYGSPNAVALDENGLACVTGGAFDARFPVTPGAYDTSHNGRTDIFLTKLDATGSSLVFSTFLGGDDHDQVEVITRDPSTGRWLVAGISSSTNYPTTPGAYQLLAYENGASNGVFSLLDPTGSKLIYSTALGGSFSERIQSAKIDATGTVHLAGTTSSPDFPVTPGAFDTSFAGISDGFVVKMRPGPVLDFIGTPATGQAVHYQIEQAASSETGNMALVFLSTSGTSGVRLPGGQVLPLTFDAATSLGLQISSQLIATIDAQGNAATPVTPFPAVPPGLTFYSAAATWNLGSAPKVLSVTPPMVLVTQ